MIVQLITMSIKNEMSRDNNTLNIDSSINNAYRGIFSSSLAWMWIKQRV